MRWMGSKAHRSARSCPDRHPRLPAAMWSCRPAAAVERIVAVRGQSGRGGRRVFRRRRGGGAAQRRSDPRGPDLNLGQAAQLQIVARIFKAEADIAVVFAQDLFLPIADRVPVAFGDELPCLQIVRSFDLEVVADAVFTEDPADVANRDTRAHIDPHPGLSGRTGGHRFRLPDGVQFAVADIG